MKKIKMYEGTRWGSLAVIAALAMTVGFLVINWGAADARASEQLLVNDGEATDRLPIKGPRVSASDLGENRMLVSIENNYPELLQVDTYEIQASGADARYEGSSDVAPMVLEVAEPGEYKVASRVCGLTKYQSKGELPTCTQWVQAETFVSGYLKQYDEVGNVERIEVTK